MLGVAFSNFGACRGLHAYQYAVSETAYFGLGEQGLKNLTAKRLGCYGFRSIQRTRQEAHARVNKNIHGPIPQLHVYASNHTPGRPKLFDAKPAQTKGRTPCFLQVDGQHRCATSLGKGSRTRPCVLSAVEQNHRKQIVDPPALSGDKTRGNRRYQQSRPITRKSSPEKRIIKGRPLE